MSKIRTYARNLAANWIGYGANLVVALFLTPFIIHSLGDARYGIWTLIMSVAGYLGLADIGVRVSVGRYVNMHMAEGDVQKVNQIVNSALALFSCIGVVLLGLAFVLGALLPQVFPKIPPAHQYEARIVLLLLAADMLFGFLASTLWHVVTAHERFDIRNGAAVAVLGLRTVGIVSVLSAGHGLVALAMVTVGASALSFAISIPAAGRIDPTLRICPGWCSLACVRRLLAFGGAAFFNAVSQRVIYLTDALVIGWLLGVAEIAYYSVGLMFVQYARALLQQIVRTMYPEMAKRGGMQDLAAARWLTIRTTRMVMLFTVPLMAGFMTLGKPFILVWMDDPAFGRSATILLILAAGQAVSMSAESWRNMLISLGRPWWVSGLGLAEAATNLALSVLFVTRFGMGINGVALGTLIPSVLFMGLVLPAVGSRLMRMNAGRFALTVGLRWAAALAVCCAIGLVFRWIPLPGTWSAVALKIACAGLLMAAASWFLAISRDDRAAVRGVFSAGRGPA